MSCPYIGLRKKKAGVHFLLSCCGLWRPNSGHQSCKQALLPVVPSLQPRSFALQEQLALIGIVLTVAMSSEYTVSITSYLTPVKKSEAGC